MRGFHRNPWWLRHFARRCVQSTWAGLVAMGSALATGEARPPQRRLKRPPEGHPEQLCPDRPLTELERSLLRELALRPWPRDAGPTGS